VEIWNPEEQNPKEPLALLDTTGVMPCKLQLSTNGVLAVSGDRRFTDSFSTDVKVRYNYVTEFVKRYFFTHKI